MRCGKKLWLAVCAAVAAGVMAPVASATSPVQAYKTADAHWTRTFEWTIKKSVSPDAWDLETGQSGTSTYTVEVTKGAPVGRDLGLRRRCAWRTSSATPTENLKVVDRLQALVGERRHHARVRSARHEPEPGARPGRVAVLSVLDPVRAGRGRHVPEQRARHGHERSTCSRRGDGPEREGRLHAARADGRQRLRQRGRHERPLLALHRLRDADVHADVPCDEDEGTHKNTATIRETGQSDDASVSVTCKAPPKPGCTLTQGYWKTHSKYGPAPYDATWALIGEDTTFFSSGKTWHQAIDTSSAGGNAYYILAHQYIAAKLNLAGGGELDARRQRRAGLGGRLLCRLHAGVHAVEGSEGAGNRLRRHACRLQRRRHRPRTLPGLSRRHLGTEREGPAWGPHPF